MRLLSPSNQVTGVVGHSNNTDTPWKRFMKSSSHCQLHGYTTYEISSFTTFSCFPFLLQHQHATTFTQIEAAGFLDSAAEVPVRIKVTGSRPHVA